MIEVPYKQIEKVEKKGKLTKTEEPSIDIETLNKRFDRRFQTVREKVIKILREDEFARKKDWWLTIRLWAMSGHIKIITPMDKLIEINAPESISRIRRSLVNEAKNGNKDLKFLLKDKETLIDHENKYLESRNVWAYKRDSYNNSIIAGEIK